MTMTWPAALKARRCDIEPRNFTKSGGRNSTGDEQIVYSDAGRIEVRYGSVYVDNAERAAAYRKMIARLRQGEDILLTVFNAYRPVEGGAPSVVVQSSAALRTTTLSLTATDIDIEEGSWFSLGDRLHLVTELTTQPASPSFLNPLATRVPWSGAPWSSATTGGATYVAKILPPLRAAVPAGTTVSFENLVLRARLKAVSDGDLDLDRGLYGTVDMTFVEAR